LVFFSNIGVGAHFAKRNNIYISGFRRSCVNATSK